MTHPAQSSIFDLLAAPVTAPYQAHSDTSRAAAESIAPRVRSDQMRVLDYLQANKAGATDEAMQAALGMLGSTQRPRRISLVASGRVRDSGTKRPTASGRSAVVWIAVEGGVQ